MGGEALIQAMWFVLLGVVGIAAAFIWIALGASTERHRWSHRFYRLLTAVISLGLLGVFLYVAFGPGRAWLNQL